MSSDTVKDDASVVDSSTTQKHDAGNLDEPESSSHRANEDGYPSTTEEQGGHESLMGNSCAVQHSKMYSTRYFIIKSLNHQNIQLSVDKGIWATQVMNEPILEEAFHNSGRVILIFSVNMSGYFQGYAQMMSSVGRRRDDVWSQGAGGNNPWGRTFRVKWLRLNNLPFHKTLHLKNPMNEYKPVKISRDCQELSPDIGAALCELIDQELEVDGEEKRDMSQVRGHGVDPTGYFPEQGYNGLPINMTWARPPMFYPSLLYQYPAASRSCLTHQGPVGAFYTENLPFVADKAVQSKHPCYEGDVTDSQAEPKFSSQFDGRQLSGKISPVCSNLSEEEFLEMSYEEYLVAHSKGNKRLCNPGAGRLRRKEVSSSEEHDDDMHNVSNEGRSRKRSHSRSR